MTDVTRERREGGAVASRRSSTRRRSTCPDERPELLARALWGGEKKGQLVPLVSSRATAYIGADYARPAVRTP
jgi:hypothetical protein